ncbi:MAG: hypothetical protein PHR53_04825, partial [Bacteroidales bacterium]|nr:hypothetical protein [Bacteroidales bacterium]
MKRPEFLQKLITRQYFSSWIILLTDAFISIVCTFIAILVVRYITRIIIPANYIFPIELIVFVVSLIVFYAFKTSQNIIRHSTLHEIFSIGLTVLVKNAVMVFVYYFIVEKFWMDDFPIVFVVIVDAMLTFIALIFIRIFMLLFYEQIKRVNPKSKNILIYGYDNQSVSLSTSLQNNEKFHVSGFFIPSSKKHLNRIAGYSTYSCDDEETFNVIVSRHNIYGILFPDYESAQQENNRLIRFCEKNDIKVLFLPPINE